MLYPPCTYLTCKSVSSNDGVRHIIVTARYELYFMNIRISIVITIVIIITIIIITIFLLSVSNARPDLKRIATVTDNDKDNDCLDRVLDKVNL